LKGPALRPAGISGSGRCRRCVYFLNTAAPWMSP
jgi:hypothetical protein